MKRRAAILFTFMLVATYTGGGGQTVIRTGMVLSACHQLAAEWRAASNSWEVRYACWEES